MGGPEPHSQGRMAALHDRFDRLPSVLATFPQADRAVPRNLDVVGMGVNRIGTVRTSERPASIHFMSETMQSRMKFPDKLLATSRPSRV